MDINKLTGIKSRAEEAKRMIAEVTDEISVIDRKIEALRAERASISALPKHFDEWVSECVENSIRLADANSGWRTQLVKTQDASGWRAAGQLTNPAGNFMPHDGVLFAAVTQAALLSLLGPEIIEAGLRRMAGDLWPKDCIRQTEKDKLIGKLNSEMDVLTERRRALAACLPG